jgi:hypothetical protein
MRMKVWTACALLWCACSVAVAQAPPPPPGFTITLDGGKFANRRLVLRPAPGSYTNNYWTSVKDPRINRLSLNSLPENGGPELKIQLPVTGGAFVFDRGDEEKPDRNPYLGFFLIFDEPGEMPKVYTPGRVEVTINKFDPPGGRIEGTLSGTLEGPGDVVVTIKGAFSVLRNKDRKVD